VADLQQHISAALAVLGADAVHAEPSYREFLQHGSDGQLRFQRCTRCSYLRYPAAPVCPDCLCVEAEWVIDDGMGSVWSSCVYHRGFTPVFRALVPYEVCLIELDSGPRLITNPVSDERVPIGARGRIRMVPVDNIGLPFFMPGGDHDPLAS